MNDEVTEEKEIKNNRNGSKKKRIAIIIIIAVVVLIAIIAIAVRSNVTSVGVEETEQLATLKVGSNGTYELTVVNYASSSDSNGEQNFIIQKTDEYGNPLQGVEFEIAGNFRTSYIVEFYDADNSNTIMSDYTQTFYGSHWDDKYITTDEEGKISLTLQYGDYGIAESKSLYGYEDDENVYWIRVDKSGINIIDESKVDWDDANFDEADTINVSTASIKDTLGSISGYALDHIELNGTNLGTSEDNLPTTVNDGDVIKIYIYMVEKKLASYNLVLYVIADVDNDGKLTYESAEYLTTIAVDNADYVNLNGEFYIKLDIEEIFEKIFIECLSDGLFNYYDCGYIWANTEEYLYYLYSNCWTENCENQGYFYSLLYPNTALTFDGKGNIDNFVNFNIMSDSCDTVYGLLELLSSESYKLDLESNSTWLLMKNYHEAFIEEYPDLIF